MVINKVELVKCIISDNEELAIIFSYDEYNSRQTTSQPLDSWAVFPISEEQGHQIIQEWTGKEEFPSYAQINDWGCYQINTSTLGPYDVLEWGNFNQFSKEVYFGKN